MPSGSHRERVIAEISVSSRPLDDDQIGARNGITPRQTVNQICRALERAGLLRRLLGPDGKVVNEWLGNQEQERGNTPASAGAVPGMGVSPDAGADPDARAAPAGDSGEQRAAERVMLDLVGAQLGCELSPARITVPSGERVEVDGADASRTVLAECWAHQGPRRARSATKYSQTPSGWPG